MHYHVTEVAGVVEKFLPDPGEVVDGLLVNGNVGAQAGVDETITSEDAIIL
jgi:hypothetical protein